jgi:quercetin dioxygenase-like cupin family protein
MDRSSGEGGLGGSRVVRFANFSWEGIKPKGYKASDPRWHGVVRHAILGQHEGMPFHVRYFEVEPNGFTTLERHEHQHVVVPIRGEGRVRLGKSWEEIGFGDVVYVAPHEAHQFRAAADEPLGFLCIVAARRDRPVPLEPPGDA